MRYIYNCVKLVLLIACLGFAGQSSAVKPIELGGLLFDMSSGKLQVSASSECNSLVREDTEVRPVNGYFVDICDLFTIYFKEGFALKKATSEDDENACYERGNFLSDLSVWAAICTKGDEHTYNDEEDSYNSVTVPFTHFALAGAISQLFVKGESKSTKDGVTFTKDFNGVVTVQTPFNVSMKLDNWIEGILLKSNPSGECRHRHIENEEEGSCVDLPVFVDLSKLTNVLAPVVDALQSSVNHTTNQENDETLEDFGGFGDLF